VSLASLKDILKADRYEVCLRYLFWTWGRYLAELVFLALGRAFSGSGNSVLWCVLIIIDIGIASQGAAFAALLAALVCPLMRFYALRLNEAI
jgi:hypothetical protein